MSNKLTADQIRQAHLEALTDPKRKLSGRQRRYAMRMRENWANSVISRQAPKDPMLKLTQKLARCSAGRLVRFIKQSARRASTAKHLLAKLHEQSVFHPGLVQQQKSNLISFVAASAELDNRGKASAS